ncbi:ATP-grasp domain-containing protein [Pseudomonas chlororaphis]|nr:ATP-grasp domain-containing protein [Pseudomonas chlororaphis]
MKKLLIVEVVSRQEAFYYRYDIFRAQGYELFYLTTSDRRGDYPFNAYRQAASRQIEDLLDAAQRWHAVESFDCVLTTDEASVVGTAIISRALGLPGLGAHAAKSRNKWLMRQAHQSFGAPHPFFSKCDTLAEAIEFSETIGYPVVLKPTLGGDAEHVYKINSSVEMAHYYPLAKLGNDTHSHRFIEAECADMGPHTLLVERFLNGSEHCIEAIISGDTVYIGSIADRLSIELNTFDNDLYATPTALAQSDIEALTEAVRLGAMAQGIVLGVLHAEVRFHDGKPYIVEIAARPGGGSLQYMAKISYGYCPIIAALRVAEGRLPEQVTMRRTGRIAVGLTMLCEGGVLKNISLPENLVDNPQVFNLKILPSIGDRIVRPPYGNDILGFLGTTGVTVDEALDTAHGIYQQLKIEIGAL